MTSFVVLWGLVLLLTSLTSGQLRVVDLSYTRGVNTLYWPGIPRFNFTILVRGIFENHWLESNWFSTAEHGGTHLDAPAHFYKGHNRVHQIPPERLVGPGVVIDVSGRAATNPHYQVLKSDVTSWEQANGRIPDGAVVIMNSGWGSRYPSRSRVFNTNSPEDPTTFRYPGWHVDTVKWLVNNRRVIVIGVDTPSTDYGSTRDFAVHQTLGRYNISGLENIANVERLPSKGMTVFVGVTKIYDGSGGPARVFALLDPQPHPCSCPRPQETRFRRTRGSRDGTSGCSTLSTFSYISVVSILFCRYMLRMN